MTVTLISAGKFTVYFLVFVPFLTLSNENLIAVS